MPTTVNDLVNDALNDAGIVGFGTLPLPEDSKSAFRILNQMLYQWNTGRFVLYNIETFSLVSTGAVSYTVGPGGDFDTTNEQRPNTLEYCVLRQPVTGSTPVDFWLSPIFAKEDYERIAVKEMGDFSRFYFYETSFPLARLYPWPVPQSSVYTLRIGIKKQLSQFTSLSQEVELPGEYYSALRYNLALRVCASKRFAPTTELKELAKSTLNGLKDGNFQPATLKMPKAILPATGSTMFNIYTGY